MHGTPSHEHLIFHALTNLVFINTVNDEVPRVRASHFILEGRGSAKEKGQKGLQLSQLIESDALTVGTDETYIFESRRYRDLKNSRD